MIDHNIVFQTKHADIQDTYRNSLNNVAKRDAIKNNRLLAPVKQELYEAQTEQTQLANDTTREKQRFQSMYTLANQVAPFFEVEGGIEQLKTVMLERIADIQERRLSGEVIDSNESEQFYQALSTNPELAKQMVVQTLQMGQQMGGGGNAQFGSSKTVKDSAGNLYQVTDRRNPSTGGVSTAYAPISPDAPQQPVGQVDLVGSSGMTSGESLAYKKEESKDKQTEVRLTNAVKMGTKAGYDTFQDIAPVDQSLSLIDEAIQALDDGADTGYFTDMLPTVREASKSLQNVKNRMGLNVVSSVTFGALSEGELKLAMSTALPTTKNPEELRKWLINKKEAQTKLRNNLNIMATYLGNGDKTISDWLKYAKTLKKDGVDPLDLGI